MPDIVFSMSDVPFNSPPHSQKRISKSIERSAQWLMSIFAPPNAPSIAEFQDHPTAAFASESLSLDIPRLNVFVHMVGGIMPAARSAFAAALLEPLESKEKQLVQLATLDEGVSGYVFDLVPIRVALVAERAGTTASTHHSHHASPLEVNGTVTESLAPLIRASLEDLPVTKLRLVNTAFSPHEMLRLIRDAGVDLFDTYWAQQAANWGVALDFRFPIALDPDRKQAATDQPKKYQVGHNLYDQQFAHDFTRLAHSFLDELEYSKRQNDLAAASPHTGNSELAICSCAACSPTWTNDPLIHSTADDTGIALGKEELASPYTRAYMHHLLHTHEMSAHTLLVMHNLTVMDAFMCGVRAVLQRDHESSSHSGSHVQEVMATGSDELSGTNGSTFFATEVARFEQTYDERLQVLAEAKMCWAEVDLARGKGRLARERAKALGD
jgi:Queuine tRNA-ribosyltransferase